MLKSHRRRQRDEPCRVGDLGNPAASPVLIVHISDTRMFHNSYVDLIPYGDILVHSGGFARCENSQNSYSDAKYCEDVRRLDRFFRRLPHTHKIFVAGSHETNFPNQDPTRTQSMLKHAVYLQDASVILEGIKFYGSPWSKRRQDSAAKAFAVKSSLLEERWQRIPNDVDVLVTHSPPEGIMDCNVGCALLRTHVLNRVRPKAHLFGHVNGASDRLMVENGIVFSNAAMTSIPSPQVIQFYIKPEKRHSETGPHVAKKTAVT